MLSLTSLSDSAGISQDDESETGVVGLAMWVAFRVPHSAVPYGALTA